MQAKPVLSIPVMYLCVYVCMLCTYVYACVCYVLVCMRVYAMYCVSSVQTCVCTYTVH